MRRNFSIGCLLFAWFCANGALWNVVQVIGWTKMFYDNSSVMSMSMALEATFNGSAPCNLCHISQTAEDTARQQLPNDALPGSGLEKLILSTEDHVAFVLETPDFSWPGIVNDVGLIRSESVPVPPPRSLS